MSSWIKLNKDGSCYKSIYLIRHQNPQKASILLPKLLVLSHLSFSATFFQNLSAKNLKRIKRQINWGTKECFLRKKYDKARDLLIQTRTLPAELRIAKMSLINIVHDLARPKNSENFYSYLSLHQKTRTKPFKMTQNVKTNFGMILIVCHCVWKKNNFPQWLRLANIENVFKETLTDFLLSQHEEILLSSEVGVFKSYFCF